MPKILCIDEEVRSSQVLEDALARIGHSAVLASSVAEGLRSLGQDSFDLVISNCHRSLESGSELVELLRGEGYDIPVILLTSDTLPSAASGDGVEVVIKPVRLDALRQAVDGALAACGLSAVLEGDDIAGEMPSFIVGESAEIKNLLGIIKTVAPTRANVLIQGESGTGKELLVRAIHEQSPRAGKPFIAVNCAALPEGLVESTLFGHERGAFTGANARFVGAFERAHGGTLLLDEISELRLDLQAKLLRAIQERQFERVGGSSPVRVDVRVVATSNRDLKAEVREGRFRSDLYYRLRVVPITVPPLRERAEDIPLLVRHFAHKCAVELEIDAPSLPSATLRALQNLTWPGNVRELEHAVERAVILNSRGPLTPADFQLEAESPLAASTLPDAPSPAADDPPAGANVFNLKVLERKTIDRALAATGGHRVRAAELLGISDRTLRNKLNGNGNSNGNGAARAA